MNFCQDGDGVILHSLQFLLLIRIPRNLNILIRYIDFGRKSMIVDGKSLWREKAYRPFRCLDCQYRRELVVKHFFREKEVTSTLVMDSLYSGTRALEGQTKSKKGKAKLVEVEMPNPIVGVEKDTFFSSGRCFSTNPEGCLGTIASGARESSSNSHEGWRFWSTRQIWRAMRSTRRSCFVGLCLSPYIQQRN